jgi:hypothetical protein
MFTDYCCCCCCVVFSLLSSSMQNQSALMHITLQFHHYTCNCYLIQNTSYNIICKALIEYWRGGGGGCQTPNIRRPLLGPTCAHSVAQVLYRSEHWLEPTLSRLKHSWYLSTVPMQSVVFNLHATMLDTGIISVATSHKAVSLHSPVLWQSVGRPLLVP